ncbi:MAG: PH domain-containing protein [Microthrixaceae bacterium]
MAGPPGFAQRRIPQRVRSWHPDKIVGDLLLADEKVFEMARPDWWVVAFDQLGVALLGLVVTLVVAALLGTLPAVLVLVLVLAYVAWRMLDAWYTRYVLTDFRVLRTSGVLERNVEFIPWRKVTDVSLRRSFWQRMVGASTIRIESANEASQFRAMTDVRNPKEFFRMLQEVMAAYAGHVEL